MAPFRREQIFKNGKRDLSCFAEERKVTPHEKNVAMWSRIGQWQRERLVRLRWDGRADYCFVSLTEAGREWLAKLESRLV